MIRSGDFENTWNGGSGRSSPVPGLVDGLVTTSLEEDGSTSVRLIIGSSGMRQEERGHIELVLKREYAQMLGETLLGMRRPDDSPANGVIPPFPCSIGICIDTAEGTFWQGRASAPECPNAGSSLLMTRVIESDDASDECIADTGAGGS